VSLLGSSKEESNEVGVEIRNPHLGPANSFAAAIVLPWGFGRRLRSYNRRRWSLSESLRTIPRAKWQRVGGCS
jgi:hypothetical protein